MDMLLFPLASTLHTLGAVIWVGGMFFAHFALRPSLMAQEPPVRLQVWAGVFPRFFAWVWLSIAALLVSGYMMVINDFGSFEAAGIHVRIMHGVAWIMAGLFAYLYFVPFARFKREVAAGKWPQAAKALASIRKVVMTNLALGLFEVIAGVSGRFWGY